MGWLRGVLVASVLACVSQACASGDSSPSETAGGEENLGKVSEAITTACSFDTVGLPCDPDGPAGLKLCLLYTSDAADE